MNYKKHYERLIERAKNRKLEGYYERHHIVPRCMGGDDSKDNIANLTAREHYVAHQLLIKMYPNEYGLIKAANMMCCFSKWNKDRSANRLYEWLKIKFSEEMKRSQGGRNNSQYGTKWIHSKELKKSRKIRKDEPLPEGWDFGKYTDREEKLKQKRLLREKEKRKREAQNKQRAETLFEIYQKSCYSSIREFANSEHWEYSHVALVKLWKKYIPEKYKPEKGKRFK